MRLASPIVVAALVVAVACDAGNEAFPTPVVEPSFVIPTFDNSGEPFEKLRQGVFPVNLVLPQTDVSVWTSVRREGEPATDNELKFVVEGFVDAREEFLDYIVTVSHDAGNTYPTEPAFSLGLLSPGDMRRFELNADLPRDVRVTSISFKSGDGECLARSRVSHRSAARGHPDEPASSPTLGGGGVAGPGTGGWGSWRQSHP
jgi:hypothetical protein